jgi:hypothetical protein
MIFFPSRIPDVPASELTPQIVPPDNSETCAVALLISLAALLRTRGGKARNLLAKD